MRPMRYYLKLFGDRHARLTGSFAKILRTPVYGSARFTPRAQSTPRINLQYRALGIRDDDTIAWFWIGLHDDYDRMLARL